MTTPLISVIDTGTRAPKAVPPNLQLRHLPALIRHPLALDLNALARALQPECHVLFYSPFSAKLIIDTGLLNPARHHLWAVGDHTAQILEEALQTKVRSPILQDFEGLKALLKKQAEPLPLVALGLLGQPRDLSFLATAWDVSFTEIPIYESAPNNMCSLIQAFDLAPPDWLTLTSSRGALAILQSLGKSRLQSTRLATIGPPTAKTLEEFGLKATLIPEKPCREALLNAIANFIP